MKNILNLIEESTNKVMDPRIAEYAKANGLALGTEDGQLTKEKMLERMSFGEEYLMGLFTGHNFNGDTYDVPQIPIKEALGSGDASVLFPRVISEIMIEPTEPILFLQNVVAEQLALSPENPIYIEFPAIGALEAFEVAEDGEYQNQTASFQNFMTSIRLRKYGLQCNLTDEIIAQSLYPLITMHLRMMKAAIDRRIESLLFTAMTNYATVAFDNNLPASLVTDVPPYAPAYTDLRFQTSGVGTDGKTFNGSFSFSDLLKMAGIMIGYRYNPTHFLAHPLSWGIFATDPLLRAQFYNGGQVGTQIWTTPPKFDQTVNFPWATAIQYVPYYALNYTEGAALTTSAGSGLGNALVSDCYLLDKDHSLFLAHRGNTTVDQMENWFKDSRTMKAYKYAGVSAKDGGKGMIAARNIRMVRNYEPIFFTKNVT